MAHSRNDVFLRCHAKKVNFVRGGIPRRPKRMKLGLLHHVKKLAAGVDAGLLVNPTQVRLHRIGGNEQFFSNRCRRPAPSEFLKHFEFTGRKPDLLRQAFCPMGHGVNEDNVRLARRLRLREKLALRPPLRMPYRTFVLAELAQRRAFLVARTTFIVARSTSVFPSVSALLRFQHRKIALNGPAAGQPICGDRDKRKHPKQPERDGRERFRG